jgi:hypothetical protein
MPTQINFYELQDYVIQLLPYLLHEAPELITAVEGIVLRNETGPNLEDIFATELRYALKDEEILPDTIRWHQPLIDTEGLVFKKGYETEVDLVAQNGKLTVFEVKATAKVGEVDLFAWKVALVKAQNPTLQVHGVFICLGAPAAVKQRCLENELELLG